MEAAAQAGQQVLRHIPLAIADLLGARTVNIDCPLWLVEGLLDAEIGGAWDATDLLHQLLGQRAVLVHLQAGQLHIDLRGQAEVQNLAHHVGWQVVELGAGKLHGQLVAQRARVLRGGPMLVSQRDQDVGVSGAHRGRVRIGEIQARVRDANIVDDGSQLGWGDFLADHVLDLVAQTRRIFNAGSGLRAHMKLELAAIHRREEVLPQPRVEHRQRDDPERNDREQKRSPIFQAEPQNSVVPVAQVLEGVLEGDLEAHEGIAAGECLLHAVVFVTLQQVLCHGRHDGSREEVRRKHGEDDRLGQRNEEIAGDSAEEEHRHKNDADGEGGDEGRHGNLLGAVQDRRLDRLAQFQETINVFNRHRGIVHQDADSQCQASQGHDIDRLAQRRERQQRADDGQRNRHRDDERRTPASEKDQDHGRGQAAGDDRLAHHPADRRFDEDRLVGDWANLQRQRQLRCNLRQPRAHIGDDVQGGSVACLLDGYQRGTLPVDAHDVGLRWKTVAHIANVVNVDGGAVHGLDRQVVQCRNRVRRAVGLDLIIDVAHFHFAGGQDDVLRPYGVHHVGRGDAVLLQLLGVDVHLHLSQLAAVGVWD